AARSVRARTARADRGLRRRGADLQPLRPWGSRGALRRLPRPRRDRNGDPRGHPRQLRSHARRGRRRGIRARVQPGSGETAVALRARDREPLMSSRIEDYALLGDLQTAPDVVRIVEGISGAVRMRTELIIRFDYGSI